MKITRFLVVVLAAGWLLGAADASAFCIYNKLAKKKVWAQQLGKLKGFSGTIKPGDHKCCNWQNKDCNGKKRDTMLDMEARVEIKNGTNLGIVSVGNESASCAIETYSTVHGSNLEAKLQAGGYWVFRDNPNFKGGSRFGSDNPPFFLDSYTYDDKLITTYQCPAKQKGKPGLTDFL